MNVDGNIHVIEGVKKKHLIFDEAQDNFREIYDFKQKTNIRNVGRSMIYVKSKQKIFSFGSSFNHKFSGVCTFSLLTNKWQKVDYLKFNNHGASTVVTSDEKYIIIISPGYSGIKMSDIYVLDIRDDDNHKLKKSAIKLPKRGYGRILSRGGGIEHEYLVTGYINNYSKTRHSKIYPYYQHIQ